MKRSLAHTCLLPLALHAHTLPSGDKESLRELLEAPMPKVRYNWDGTTFSSNRTTRRKGCRTGSVTVAWLGRTR